MDIEFSPLVEWLATFALESKVIIRSNFGPSFGGQWPVKYLLTHPGALGASSGKSEYNKIPLANQNY